MSIRSLCFALLALALSVPAHAQTTFQIPPAQLAPPVVVFPGSASQVYAVNGTSTAPSISFAIRPGYGIYLIPGSNAMAFVNSDYTSASPLMTLGTGGLSLAGTSTGIGFAPAGDASAARDTTITRVAAGEFGWTAVAFASLGTPANGTFAYCSDCTIANPCASGGTGALAKRLNGVWVCS